MYCKHCGAEINENAEICLKCGMSQKTRVTKEIAYCTNCGAQLNSSQAVCTKCGVAFSNGGGKGGSSSGLHRSSQNKLIAGVCSGISETANCNPWIIRIIFLFFSFIWIGTIAYIILIFALPKE